MTKLAVTGSLAYDFISLYDRPFDEVLLPQMLSQLSVCFVVKRKERHFGGTAGNMVYNLALLGESPYLVAAAGNDFEFYRDHLRRLGVLLDYVKEYSEIGTATATIISDPKGCQISEFYPGAMAAEGDIDVSEAFSKVQLIHIAPDDPRRMKSYVQSAHAANVPYFYDPGQNLPDMDSLDLLTAVRSAEGLFLNEYEFELIKEKTSLSEEQILEEAKNVIVTHGSQGSRILTREGSVVHTLSIPSVPPSKVVDPTGCGDAYRAGFLKGYLDGRDLETCGKMGALLATYDIEQIGTQNHRLSWEDFVKHYEEVFSAAL